MKRARGQQGRFTPKSDGEHRVRTLRTTDLVWQAFGQYAESQGMTRTDVLEQLVHQWEQDYSSEPLTDLEPVKQVKSARAKKAVASTSQAR